MKPVIQLLFTVICLLQFSGFVSAQNAIVSGKVASEGKPLSLVNVGLKGTSFKTITDASGAFTLKNIPEGSYTIYVSFVGYERIEQHLLLQHGENTGFVFNLNSSATTLNDVVVTGVSRATLIRENPVSVVGISSKLVEQTSGTNIIDVLAKNTPGFSTLNTGPNISKPFIRGLGYNRVLTLYDGIRQEGQQWGDEHSIEVDAYNIHRAEVIKGPASLMFGSDALAGVVSLFPFIPTKSMEVPQGKFISEYQSNNNLEGNGLQFGFGKNNWLFMLRGSYRLAKNYRNAVDGRVYNTGFDEKNLSALVGYRNSKSYSQLNFTLYDNRQGIPDGSRDSLTRKFTKQVEEGFNDYIKNRPLVTDQELNSYQLSPLHQHIQHYRVYSNNSYSTGNSNISFLLCFQQNIRREYTHPTVPEQAGLYVRLNTLNYGLRYDAPKFAGIETSVGINGMLQNNKSKDATDFPIPDYDLLDAGAYLHAKWKNNNWTISGGFRYDNRFMRFDDFYKRKNAATGFDEQVLIPDTVNAILQFPEYKKTFGGFSASLGGTYQLNKHISFKANIGRGYRAPNITEIASNGLDPGAHIVYLGNRNFNPEFSLQEDIEVMASFEDIAATVSLFNNNIQDYIYLSLQVDANGNPVTDAQGNKTYQYLQSSAQLYGMEAWLSVHPQKWNGFSFDNSFAIVSGFNRGKQFKSAGMNGEYLPLIPPLKLLSSVTQKFQINSRLLSAVTPKIELDFNAAQDRYLGLNNSETYTAGYALINMSIITEISYSKKHSMQLQLHANNLFNKTYQSHLSRLKYFEYYSSSPNGHLGMYNMGRNICIKLVVPF